MKRSHAVALGATGLIVAGLWIGRAGNSRVDSAPTADGEAQAQIYASVDECITGRKPLMPERDANGTAKLSSEQLSCEKEFGTATANHVATAPKFAAQKDCETQYGPGQCRPATHNGASVFVPAMLGFMVANHLFGGQRNPQALLPPRQMGAAPCPPGVTPAQMPGCLVRREPSSSSSSSSGGWRSWSTSSGHTVSRNGTERASTIPAGAATSPAMRTSLGAAPSRSASPRSSTSSRSSSSTVSRGGFGSTGRSSSSSS